MLDFRMETFLAVCQYMNFTRAAEALNLTQPAVSQHIRCLEQRYGAPLFLRERRKIFLTPAGELLRDALETMRNDETALQRRMQESLRGKKILTFGVTMTIGEYAVVPALARLIRGDPETNFAIRYGNTQTLLTALREGAIDFALVEGNFKADHYETRVYRTEAYIAVAAAQHRFARPVAQLQDLLEERLLTREPGSGTRAILAKALALRNLTIQDFHRYVEVGNIHTIVSLLCQDCGISFLYRSAVERELEQGVLRQIPLKDFAIVHDFTFLWNRGSAFSAEYDRLFRRLAAGERGGVRIWKSGAEHTGRTSDSVCPACIFFLTTDL